MKIVFAGTIGRSGLGGQAWASLQYLLGFRALGHDVFYLEDCGISSWVYHWEKEVWTTELDYPAAYVRDCLEAFGCRDNCELHVARSIAHHIQPGNMRLAKVAGLHDASPRHVAAETRGEVALLALTAGKKYRVTGH